MRILRPTHIRWRLFRLLVFTAGSLVLTTAAFWRFKIEPALQMELGRSQQETARFAADQISDFINDRIGQLQATADIGRLWENNRSAQREAIHGLLKLAPQIHDVSLIDAKGNERVRLSRSRTYTEADLTFSADEENFVTARRGEIYISSVFHARTSEPFITIAVPVRFIASDIRGVLSADVSLKTLWNEVSDIKVGKSGFAYVVRWNGELIAHPDYSRVLLGETLSNVGALQEFLSGSEQGPKPGEIKTGLNGKKVLTTVSVVPQTRWAVIVEEPVESALAEIQQLKAFSAFLLLFTIAAIFAVSFRFSQKISAPIAQLEHGADRLTQGDLNHKLDIRTGDEIESLADKFNQMAVALKDSHEGLEAKIAERTREISSLYAALAPLKPAQSMNLILDNLTERLVHTTGADAGLIRFRDKETQLFSCMGINGFEESYLALTTTFPQGSAVEQVLLRNEPIISSEIAVDERLRGKKQLAAGFRSCAFLPLNIAGETRGVIHLASRTAGFFSPDKEAHLMTIARQMGVAVENQELYGAVANSKEETQRNLERIRALHNIDIAITSSLDLDDVLRVLLEQIDLFLPFGAVPSITLVDRKTSQLEPAVCRTTDEEEWKSAAMKGESRLSKLVYDARAFVAVEDIQTDSRVGTPEFFVKHDLHSYLGVPLEGSEGVLGVLGLYTKEPRRFSDSEIEFMTTLGSQAAIAIQNSRLFEETKFKEAQVRESNRFLLAVHSLAEAVSQSLDLDQVLKAAIENITEIFRFDATQIHLFEDGSDTLVLGAAFESDPARFTKARSFKRGEGIVGTVAQSGEALIFEDVQSDPRYAKLSRTNTSGQFGYRFFAVFPIKGKLRNFGTLGCVSIESRKLSAREIQLLEAMSDQIAVAIENSHLYEEVRRKVNELERQTDRLEMANKVKDEFLGVMSHELRTPLSVVTGYANLLMEEALGRNTPEQAKGLRVIKDRSEALSALVVTILDAAQLASGTAAVATESVDLASMLSAVKDSYVHYQKDVVTFNWEFSPTLPVIMTDGDKLRQIVKNLIDNALKFTECGSVTISATHSLETNSVVIQVKDTGIGITSDAMPLIFEKFRQGDSTDRRNYEGAGLGLYVVKAFTELLGGEVQVESEPGKGSTFRLMLPCLPGNKKAVLHLIADNQIQH